MFQEAVERFHQLDHRDVRTVIDEMVIGLGRVGPAPRVGEGVELRLAYLPARLAKQDVVIGVRVKGRIEINQIDTRIRKLLPIRKPFQIIAEVQPIHLGKCLEIDSFISRFSRRYPRGATVHVARPTRSILDSARNDKRDLRSPYVVRTLSARPTAGK